MRLTLLVAVIVFAVVASGSAVGQSKSGALYKIDFDPATDQQILDRDPRTGKDGLYIKVSFKLTRAKDQPDSGQDKAVKIIIEEEGKRVREIKVEPRLGELTAVLAMDISGSMEARDKNAKERRIDAAKNAAKVFFDALEAKIDTGLILFDDKIQTLVKPAGNAKKTLEHRAQLQALVQAAKPGGGTAYLDATREAVHMVKDVKGQKAVVVMTDGVDLNSKATLDEVIAEAKKAKVPVWTIGIGDPGKNEPIFTVLALDQSGSMKEPADDTDQTPKINALHEAASRFVLSMRPEAKTTLLPFSTLLNTPAPFATKKDQQALVAKIRGLKPEGETAFLSATYEAIATLDALSAPGKRAVIVLTDGVDNSSRHRKEEVIARAKEAGVALHMLAFGRRGELDEATMKELADATGGSYHHAANQNKLIEIFERLSMKLHDEGIDEKTLKRIAWETGGDYYHARDVADLRGIFKKLASDVQDQYTEIFPSQRQEQDGTGRKISLYVERGGEAASDRIDTAYNVKGVVVAEMNSILYLIFLGILGLLVVLPPTLRQLTRRSAGDV